MVKVLKSFCEVKPIVLELCLWDKESCSVVDEMSSCWAVVVVQRLSAHLFTKRSRLFLLFLS